jgi:hypothetical protein
MPFEEGIEEPLSSNHEERQACDPRVCPIWSTKMFRIGKA